MNKLVLFCLSIVLGGIIGGSLCHVIARRRKPEPSLVSEEKGSFAHKKIAIVLPVSHPSLENIRDGFKDTLTAQTKGSCSFVEYNGNGSRSLLQSQIEDIVAKEFDLIFAIATSPAVMAKEITTKKNKHMPIVYGAVTDPLGVGLIASINNSGNHITGVMDLVPHDRQLDMLKVLKPDARQMLVVYDPSAAGNEKEKDTIVSLGKHRGIQVRGLEVYNTRDIAQKVPTFISGVDTVLVLKDNTVVAGLDTLIKQCNKFGVTLMASDLDSPDRGAALGFGVYEYDMGVESAQKAHAILYNDKKPNQVPSSIADNFKIKLNKTAAEKQGLSIPKDMLFIMSSGEVVQGV